MSGEREPLLGHAGTSSSSGSQSHKGHGSLEIRVEREEQLEEVPVGTSDKMKQFVKGFFTAKSVKSKFPFLTWLPKYRLYDLQCDIISGLTVALTVLPQGLAYATIANLPQQYGLYSAFMGCFIYTIFGTSKDITLGPTAIMSLMTAAFATSPVANDPTYAILLTLMCGLVQFVMGVLHLGIMVNFISYPVINAFTSAAAITIAFGQVKGILGLTHIPREFLEMVYETCKKIPETNVWDLTMGLSSLVVLILLKQTRKIKWKDNPDGSPLTIVQKVVRKAIWLIGIAVNAIVVITALIVVVIMSQYGVDKKLSVTGKVPAGLPPFKPPAFSLKNGNETIEAAQIFTDIGTGFFIVPLLGLVEAIAIGKAFARQNNYKIQPNQELLAIGIANIVSSFVSSYPVTGSFSRTAVNSQSGVRTPLGGVVTGGVILLALAVLTPIFEYIPKAALSAVIISAVIQMVDYEILLKFWRTNKIALVPWTFTFLGSFGLGIEYGILLGIGIHLLILLYPIARPEIAFQRRIDDAIGAYGQQVSHLEYVVVTFNQAIRFPSVEYVQAKILQEMEKDEKPKSVILDCTHLATGLDYTTIQGFSAIIADFKQRNVHFAMACVLPAIRMELADAGVTNVIYGDTVEHAINAIKAQEKLGMFDDPEVVTVKNGEVVHGINNYPDPPLDNMSRENPGFESDSSYPSDRL